MEVLQKQYLVVLAPELQLNTLVPSGFDTVTAGKDNTARAEKPNAFVNVQFTLITKLVVTTGVPENEMEFMPALIAELIQGTAGE